MIEDKAAPFKGAAFFVRGAMDIIEEAQHRDIEAMADLLASLFEQEAEFEPNHARQVAGLRLILSEPQSGRLFVARQGEQVTGMVCLLFSVSTALGEPVCWLEDMVVHPESRGSGLGSKLLAHALAYAEQNGFGRVTLLTDHRNADAQRFYARHGFTLSDMTPMRRVF